MLFGESLKDSFRNKNTIHAVINREDKILKKALFFGNDLLLAYQHEALVRVVLAHNIKDTVFELREEEEKDPIISIGGTPRSTFLAIAWNLKFQVYDLSRPKGMQLVVERKTADAGLFVQEINFSPDGSKLAVAIQSGVQIYTGAKWDLAAGKENLGKDTLLTVMFDHTNQHLVVAAADGNAYRIKLEDFSVVQTYQANKAKSAFVSDKGNYVAVASEDGTAVFNMKSGELIKKLKDGNATTNHALINRSEKFVISSLGSSRVTIWDIESDFERVVALIEHSRGVFYSALSWDDRTHVSLGGDQAMVMMGFIE